MYLIIQVDYSIIQDVVSKCVQYSFFRFRRDDELEISGPLSKLIVSRKVKKVHKQERRVSCGLFLKYEQNLQDRKNVTLGNVCDVSEDTKTCR